MVNPKIIFRDCSIQHVSCFKPIYDEMVKQGFNCELQCIDVPQYNELERFIEQHKDDEFDLLITGSTGREAFVPSRAFSKSGISPEEENRITLNHLIKQRNKSILIPHGVGGEEKPHSNYFHFKGVFLVGQFWMDLFQDFKHVFCQVQCKYCGKVWSIVKESVDAFNKWYSSRKWLCHTNDTYYYAKNEDDCLNNKGHHVNLLSMNNICLHVGFQNLHLIGYPKLDLLARPERHKVASELKNQLNLPYDKTVLYAPCLKRLDNFNDTVTHLLKMMETLEVNLIIKTHCDDEDPEHQPTQYLDAKRKAEEMRNVRWVGGIVASITPYYLVSDTLVSTGSGCLREFMLVDKPSIQITNISSDLRQQFHYEGCVQSDLNDLRKNILHAIYVPEWKREQRQEQVKWLFHKPDGHATDRAVNRIKELMNW